MKQKFLTGFAAAMMLSALPAMADDAIFSEGFETQAAFDAWTKTTTEEPTDESTKTWYWASDTGYEAINSASTHSLGFEVSAEGEKVVSMFESPLIDATGKAAMVLTLTGHDINNLGNYYGFTIYLDLIKEDGTATQLAWSSNWGSYLTAASVDGWNNMKIEIPSAFNNSKFKIRFRSAHPSYGYDGGLKKIYIDDIAIAEKPAVDAAVTAMTPNGGVGGLTSVTITVLNNGSKAFSNFIISYAIAGNQVRQTITEEIAPGESKTFTFDQKADLSEIGKEYEIVGVVIIPGDADMSNNGITVKATNIVATLPYEPVFSSTTNNEYWDTSKAKTTPWALGRISVNGEYVYGWMENTRKFYDYNEPLYVRPVYIEKDQTMDIKFMSYIDNSGYGNQIDVYVVKEIADELTGDPIYTITPPRTWTEFGTMFKAPESGVYYVVFVHKAAANDNLSTTYFKTWIRNVKLTKPLDYDLNLVEFTAPATSVDEYSETEVVKVKIKNNGVQKCEGAKIVLYNDGKIVATEDLPSYEPLSENEYTFTTPIDLTGGSQGHTLKAQINWDLDMVESNNAVSTLFLAKLLEVPYKQDLYNNTYATDWSWTDNNKDGKTFQIVKVYGNDRIEYNPGTEMKDENGSTYTVFEEIPTTDESLYSPEIKFRSGKLYRIYTRLISGPSSQEPYDHYNMVVSLYKKDAEGNLSKVKEIEERDIFFWNWHNFYFNVEETGKYVVCLNLKSDVQTNYYFRFQDFQILETSEVDLELKSVTLANTYISGVTEIPTSVRVYNNGKNDISKFTVKFSSPTIGEISKTIELPEDKVLKADDTRTINLDEPLNLPIKANEELKTEIFVENDGNAQNNTAYTQLTYLPTIDVPVNEMFETTHGWMGIDGNNDSYTPGWSKWYDCYDWRVAKHDNQPDQLWSRTINLKKDTKYEVKFDYKMSGIHFTGLAFEVFAVNVADKSRTKLATVVSENGYSTTNFSTYNGYGTVPEDGVYSILFENGSIEEENPAYCSYQIGKYLIINEAETVPDMQVTEFASHAEPAVLTDAEEVTVKYKNAGTVKVEPAVFCLEAGDKTYYNVVREGVAPEEEGEITFKGVDLYKVGKYTVKATAELGADANAEDNVKTHEIESLPVVDAAVESIDGPRTGNLGAHEHIVVTIKNNGHGALTNIPVSYTLTRGVTPNEDPETPEVDPENPEDPETPETPEGDDSIFKAEGDAEGDVENENSVTVNEVIAGPIEEGETLQYTFEADADFHIEDVYGLVVTVNAEGDTDAENNSASTKIACSLADQDAGVDAIVGPTAKLMTNAEYLVISVKNFGEKDIYDIPVTATVKRGEEEVGTVTGQVAEIPAGKSVEYTFTQPVDIAMGGEYTVTAATTLDVDVNKDNDSFTGTIYANMIDCGVESIISPEADTVEGNQNITVSIKNYGDETVSEIPVYFKLGNNPQSGKFEGTIEPGSEAEYTFTAQYNFRAGRKYTLTSYTALPADMNPDNDSCELEIEPRTSSIAAINADGIVVTVVNEEIVVAGVPEDCEVVVSDLNGVVLCNLSGLETVRVSASVGIYVVSVQGVDVKYVAKVTVK